MKRLVMAAVTVVVLWPAPASAAPGTPATPSEWLRPGTIAVSPDGRDLYASGVRTLSFRRDELSGELTLSDSFGPRGSSIAITPDGRWVFVGSDDYGRELGIIHVLSRDPVTGLLTHRYTFTDTPESRIAPGTVTALAVSPDGRFLYVSQLSENSLIVLAIDPVSGALRLAQALYDGPGGGELALSPDGTSVYAGGYAIQSFARDPESGRLTELPPPERRDHGLQALHVAVAPDGRRVYAGILNYSVYGRDPAGGQLTWLSNAQLDAGCQWCVESGPMAISPDGSAILSVHSTLDRLLQAAPTDDGAQLAHSYEGLPGANDGSGMAWSPDGRFAYVSGGERYTADGTGYDYNTGGKIAVLRRDGDALTSVAEVVPALPAPDRGLTPSVSLNRGAIYTNDPQVEVTVTVPEWQASSFRVANAPDFDGVVPTRVTAQSAGYSWRLDTSAGPVRSVKHVWVRFTGDGVHSDNVMSDDIILDQVPPEIVSAQLQRAGRRFRLVVQARDNRSGVRRLQVTKDRRRPGKARKFSARVIVAGAPRVLFLRVIDGAGNVSPWSRARR